MTTIHLTIHLPDDDALTPDEFEALLDPEVFPVSCKTCKHVLSGHLVDLGSCACAECISGPDAGFDREGWEPRA